jgi:hypothetical protein
MYITKTLPGPTVLETYIFQACLLLDYHKSTQAAAHGRI